MARSTDLNADFTVNGPDYTTGAKIWLVLTADINADSKLSGWNPSEYLFEHHPIDFDDTDVP